MKKEFTNEEKIAFFEDELKFIKREDVRKFAEMMLTKTQNYFFYVPASSTGKYHPKYTTGEHGLVLHTKALMQILNDMTTIEQSDFTDDEKDLLFVAGLLHDTMKLGNNPDGYTVVEHPSLAADRVKDCVSMGFLKEDELYYIADAIESHMGQWNTDRKGNEVLPKPTTEAQKIVHLADYLASRKHIEFNFAGYEDSYKNKVLKAKKYEKALNLYLEGKTIEEIGAELSKEKEEIIDLLVNAYKDNKPVYIEKFINPEHEKGILEIVNDETWDGYLRSVKRKLPEDVPYCEINAVLALHNIQKEKKKKDDVNVSKAKEEKPKNKELCVEDFINGKTIENIAKKRGLSLSTVEGYIINSASSNEKINLETLIDPKYEEDILKIVKDESWNGRLKPVKEKLPEEVTYNCIKAVIIKYNVVSKKEG